MIRPIPDYMFVITLINVLLLIASLVALGITAMIAGHAKFEKDTLRWTVPLGQPHHHIPAQPTDPTVKGATV